MFGFIKKIFVGLLSICTIVNFGESLSFYSKRTIKCVSLHDHLR